MKKPIAIICVCGREPEVNQDTRFAVLVYAATCKCGMQGPHAETPSRASELLGIHCAVLIDHVSDQRAVAQRLQGVRTCQS